MPQPLSRRTPLARQLQDQPERIPWDAFAVDSGTAQTYGQPSPALMARAERGWRRLGAMHARLELASENNTAEEPET
ncbi:hypothetical protein [Streptomyces sp. NBC_00105]|uniref:hypothetical protein n=1 Tax=Streptomyces sp. NBC_00105 TaxID=2903622 RepID=UPI00324589E0